jgi:hypothetical protein
MRPFSHMRFNFSPGPGLKTVAVDADVEGFPERLKPAVAVPE